MSNEINIYCDESRHLEKDRANTMVIGAVMCSKSEVKSISQRIRDIKKKHRLSKTFEIKWSKVSPSKVAFYLDLIDLFFDTNDASFRGVIIPNKNNLNHINFKQTHDEFIYKMHYEVIKVLLDPKLIYHIYIDMKDTQGGKKIQKLHDVICNAQFDFEKKIIQSVVQVQAEQIELVQICDLLIGAVCYANNNFTTSKAKQEIIRKIQYRSSYSLKQTTLIRENKFNLLVISPREKP